jgi:hypothetical protein
MEMGIPYLGIISINKAWTTFWAFSVQVEKTSIHLDKVHTIIRRYLSFPPKVISTWRVVKAYLESVYILTVLLAVSCRVHVSTMSSAFCVNVSGASAWAFKTDSKSLLYSQCTLFPLWGNCSHLWKVCGQAELGVGHRGQCEDLISHPNTVMIWGPLRPTEAGLLGLKSRQLPTLLVDFYRAYSGIWPSWHLSTNTVPCISLESHQNVGPG